MAEKFVCVRIQSMNGVNINQFQFEYDLTWMSFFQNADGRTYLRYGGREDHDPESHLNKESLLRVMRQALALHDDGSVQPDSRYEPVAASVRTPEDIPTMKAMMAKRKESCIHCHDVKIAQLRHLRDQGRLVKDLVFTYPSPSQLGIQLDPAVQYKVQKVDAESPAEVAGIRTGDLIRTIDGQRVLTLADMSRVLELTPKSGTLAVGIERDKETVATAIRLPDGWRKSDDPSWRSSTGVMGPSSGFWGVAANGDQRRQLGLTEDDLAIRVTFLWGPWIKESGLRNGDYVVAIDGQKTNMTIRQLQAYLHLNRNWGDKIDLVVCRDGKDVKLTMQFPDEPPN